MDWPILDVKILDHRTGGHLAHDNEVIGPKPVSTCVVLNRDSWSTNFGTPPFDPCPSQYACPFPSMMASGVDVMVTFFPPNVIGLKVLEFVNAKVVNPAKVTTELAFKPARSTLLLLGTAISCKVIAVQEATAGAIWEYAVQVHGVPVDAEPSGVLLLLLEPR